MNGRNWLLLITGCLLSIASVTAQQPDSGTNPAGAGIEAFNAGRYGEALRLFSAAEEAGDSSEALQYNVAVSLYRLGRYAEAEQRFLALIDAPRWRGLVSYNLGLVYEAQEQYLAAVRYYSIASEEAEQEQVRQLASRKLNARSPVNPVTPQNREIVGGVNHARKWAVLTELGLGSDSNASSLADDLLEESDRSEDRYSQLLVYGHRYLLGEQYDGLRLYGLAYGKQFDEFDELNSGVFGIGLVWEQPVLGFLAELGTTFTGTRLDANPVADQLQLSVALSRTFRPGTIRLALSHADVRSAESFDRIDGTQHRIDLSWAKRLERTTLSLRLRHEDNNREDQELSGGFASYSPERLGIRSEVSWQPTASMQYTLGYEYIDSEYDGVNRLQDTDGVIKTFSRENERSQASLEFAYRFSRNWKGALEYRHGNVEDNYNLYTYDKNSLQATMQFQF